MAESMLNQNLSSMSTFPTPLEKGAVRLVVFQPVQADPLIQLAHSACHNILGSLPPGMLCRISRMQYIEIYAVIKPAPQYCRSLYVLSASPAMLLNVKRA